MNSVCKEIFRAIHEGKWLKIEYCNKAGDVTNYWIGIKSIDVGKSFYMLPVPIVEHAEKNPQKVLQAYANAWKSQGCYPKEVRCRDERTYALLKDFSEKTDVKISIYKKAMPALDDAETAFG